ncbi:MAG: hypothetical protein P8163_08935 [Candidatus Thiodiazotropha sp.]
MNSDLKQYLNVLFIVFGCLFLSTPVHAVYECFIEGVKSYQETPCDQHQAVAERAPMVNQQDYAELYKKLDFLAYQGYGLNQSRKPKAKSVPSKLLKSLCGELSPLQDPGIYRNCSKKALNELTQRKNAKSTAVFSRYTEGLKAFCGSKWQQSPYPGMVDEDFMICSRRGRIDQQILIEQNGHFATLYVLNNSQRNKVYLIDGVIRKIITAANIRSFR